MLTVNGTAWKQPNSLTLHGSQRVQRLVGILAAMAGAKDVISTDLADNLSLIDRNIQANGSLPRQMVSSTKACLFSSIELASPSHACTLKYIQSAPFPATCFEFTFERLQSTDQAQHGPAGVQAKVASVPLKWGTDDVKALELPFDLAIACGTDTRSPHTAEYVICCLILLCFLLNTYTPSARASAACTQSRLACQTPQGHCGTAPSTQHPIVHRSREAGAAAEAIVTPPAPVRHEAACMHARTNVHAHKHADVMYIVDAVEPLAATLAALIGRRGRALVAHGRNCCAEDAFVAAAAAAGLTTAPLPPAVLHPRYRAQDITVLLLQHRDRASGADEGEVAAGAVQVA